MLKSSDKNKFIAHENSARSVESLKDSVDAWLENEFLFPGDAIKITGGMESELELACTNCFCEQLKDSTGINDNDFFARVLFSTASCIGAGLNYSDAHGVIRAGFPASTLDLI